MLIKKRTIPSLTCARRRAVRVFIDTIAFFRKMNIKIAPCFTVQLICYRHYYMTLLYYSLTE